MTRPLATMKRNGHDACDTLSCLERSSMTLQVFWPRSPTPSWTNTQVDGGLAQLSPSMRKDFRHLLPFDERRVQRLIQKRCIAPFYMDPEELSRSGSPSPSIPISTSLFSTHTKPHANTKMKWNEQRCCFFLPFLPSMTTKTNEKQSAMDASLLWSKVTECPICLQVIRRYICMSRRIHRHLVTTRTIR